MSALRYLLFALALHLAAAPAAAEAEPVVKPVDSFLVLGPVPVQLPVFHDVESIRGETFGADDLLIHPHVRHEDWWPDAGQEVGWSDERTLTWRTLRMRRDTTVRLEAPEGDRPSIAYLATYIDADRYVTPTLRLESTGLAQVFLNGSSVATKLDGGEGAATAELELAPGKHLLLVKVLREPDAEMRWTAGATLTFAAPEAAGAVSVITDPKRRMSLDLLLDTPQAAGTAVSPDGALAALTLRQVDPETGEARSWLEIRRTDDGGLVQSFRGGMVLADVRWAPTGRRFSYTTTDDDGARSIWTVDLATGTTTAVLEDVEDLAGYTWAPDGASLFYQVTEQPEADETGVTRLEGMPDRWPWYRTRSSLYQVRLPEGTGRRLTAGLLSSSLEAVAPDGRHVVIAHDEPDFSRRPYSRQTVYLMDVETRALDTLWTSPWSAGDIAFSPDGGALLVLAGPSAFGGLGSALPEDTTPNDYDTQAYLFDLETRTASPLTRDFDPAVAQGAWSADGRAIYFRVTEGSYERLYRFDLERRRFERVETGVEVMGTFELALRAPRMVYVGSSAADPHRVYTLDLDGGTVGMLADPAAADYEHVAFGRVEPWAFTNERGVEIEGRVYYPPDFDPEARYPALVYYYGGTSVVDRAFGGRYPKNLYAAHGYVVYVLQPSGAPGYGQAFSARHVNDWGQVVAGEIVEGVEQFLEAHPFVDRDRVGAMGASYGGFMTMLLLTETDLFGAAVAHAGISSLASYWGEGYWGYLYSAVASAESFPWNRADLYVEQSPLFRADRITTPLLLVHGAADTNVPVGESLQLYTALRLLGREVELVEVEGQDHHILDYEKRRRWTDTILAWFARELKGEPAWWEALHPPVTTPPR